MKTEEELRKLFYNYTNGHIEISYSETEPVMDVDAFIKLMAELNLCNKHIVTQRSELLFDFIQKYNRVQISWDNIIDGEIVRLYLKGKL